MKIFGEDQIPVKRRFLFIVTLFAALGLIQAQSVHAVTPVNATKTTTTSIVKISTDDKMQEGAKTFVSSMAQRGIDFLANPDLSQDKRQKEFEKLLTTSFDMNTIAKFALGRYWRSASTSQRNEYLKLFRKMIIEVYSNRFSEYDGQNIEVRNARAQGKRDTIVSSFIIPEEGPEIEVEWRVRYKDGRYKIIDVIVEGVSMGVTQRADFASVIQRGGGKLDVLLDHLRGA